jgi:flavin-dependent dehydrogenase
MKKQTGGKSSCRREKTKGNCITYKCVDYEKEIYEAIEHEDCTTDAKNNDWRMHYDEEAHAFYWHNSRTGQASWIYPDNKKKTSIQIANTNTNEFDKLNKLLDEPDKGGKSKKRQKRRKTNKKRKTKRNKKI